MAYKWQSWDLNSGSLPDCQACTLFTVFGMSETQLAQLEVASHRDREIYHLIWVYFERFAEGGLLMIKLGQQVTTKTVPSKLKCMVTLHRGQSHNVPKPSLLVPPHIAYLNERTTGLVPCMLPQCPGHSFFKGCITQNKGNFFTYLSPL